MNESYLTEMYSLESILLLISSRKGDNTRFIFDYTLKQDNYIALLFA